MSDVDPLDFVRDVLDHLPALPADCTADDLLQLAAAAEGLTRISTDSPGLGDLAARIVAGASHAETADERWEAEARQLHAERAEALLMAYTEAACAAHGIDIRLMVGE